MVLTVHTDFLAVGCNRHPAAADWDAVSGFVAFGADRNIAIWNALNNDHRGICALLFGHTDKVNVVKFFNRTSQERPLIISGSADKTIRIWSLDPSSPEFSKAVAIITDSETSINAIAVEAHSGIFVTGSADINVKIRRITFLENGDVHVSLLQTISVTPRFFPLALALSPLTDSFSSSSLILAIGGTRSITQIYVSLETGETPEFQLQATLTGHEGWIRSLAFVLEKEDEGSDLLLASASQDKYIRLWRVHQGQELPPAVTANASSSLGALGKSLSNKAHRFQADGLEYSVTFEALLLGHEDWVYTVSWFRDKNKLQLLSASADSSLAIWEADISSGIWICSARLGEISGQKGATTATGSTGGYWIGLWSLSGRSVISLGRTGGWRIWSYKDDQNRWLQSVAVGGHVKEVTGLAWARGGGYLLSTSSDQTTRLFAEWKRSDKSSWHEFSRPQIHGYDLNCIDSLDDFRFVSGADEKLLRVFDQPKTIADLLKTLSGIQNAHRVGGPETASIPVLGLSNKAVEAQDDEQSSTGLTEAENEETEPSSKNQDLSLDLAHPPLEDQLARHTLWPESEKLYGHGYEISTVAISHDRTLVATACRASSIDHAVIRIYETKEWREVKPALKAHSLTVTRLRFSNDDEYLLSVGRDRQWVIYGREPDPKKKKNQYHLISANPKGHSRMILDASWAPMESGRTFATASRDKSAKIWQLSNTNENTTLSTWSCTTTITATHPMTAIDFLPQNVRGKSYLIIGIEDGSLQLYALEMREAVLEVRASHSFDPRIVPSRTITQVSWRPQENSDGTHEDGQRTWQVAVASDDSSVRIYGVDLDEIRA
ncbi:MAG: hypothetical protein M1816_000296 [Peltula sp. TS41687]|nr:MAG: hypothetical protein M1816_000296 [Peltula sp. TS41687]